MTFGLRIDRACFELSTFAYHAVQASRPAMTSSRRENIRRGTVVEELAMIPARLMSWAVVMFTWVLAFDALFGLFFACLAAFLAAAGEGLVLGATC